MGILSRFFPKVLPRQAVLPERQEVAFIRPQARPSWDQSFSGFVNPFFRISAKENLYLNEQLVEMIPVINAAVDRITQLVGCPVVMSEDEDAASDLNEWLDGVRVNRVQTGFSNFLPGAIKAHLVYGRSHVEIIPTARYTDIYALQILHSRTIEAMPRSDGYGVQWVQSWPAFFEGKPLDDDLLLTFVHDMRDDNPHGSSLLYGLPFVGEIYGKLLVSLKNTWERYGTPVYFVRYRPAKELSDPQGTSARAVVGTVITGLQDAMAAKANGQIRDIGAAGDFDIEILGANGEALDISIPGRHVVEQVITKLGIPPFLLGIQWATTERLSSVQASLLGELIDEIREHLEAQIRYLFRLRQVLVGRPFEFEIDWEAPSLIDAMEEAQGDKARAEADQAKLKHDLELSRLGMLPMWRVAERNAPMMEGKTEEEILRDLPDLQAVAPPVMLPAAPGQGPQGQGPPTPPNFPGGARSITYGEGLFVKSNGTGH